MNRLKTLGLIGLAGIIVAALADHVMGFGVIASLGGLGDGALPLKWKLVLLIAFSLFAMVAAITAIRQGRRIGRPGRTAPGERERDAILSSIVLIATTHGRISQSEVADVYHIVTGHPLEDELIERTCRRFETLQDDDLRRFSLPALPTAIARRRAIAAALIVGCVARPAAPGMKRLVERIAFDVKASSADVAAAYKALSDWQKDVSPVEGVSPIALLRHRVLGVKPA